MLHLQPEPMGVHSTLDLLPESRILSTIGLQMTLDNKYLEYRNRRLQKELSCDTAHLNRLTSHTVRPFSRKMQCPNQKH